MSIRVMTRVWDKADAAEGELLVLLALADFADDDGRCYPKVTQIARKARLTERQVYNVLARLRERGEIETLAGGGRGRPTCYLILSGLAPDDRTERVKEFQGYHQKTLNKIPEKISGKRGKTAKNPEMHTLANPEMTIGEFGSVTPNDDPIRHGGIRHENHEPPPPFTHTNPEGGGGGGNTPAVSETEQALLALGATPQKARALAPRATLAQIAHLTETGQGRARDLAAWVLSGIASGVQPPPERNADAPVPARRAGRRGPAPERPAGSGPPPGVDTPTPEDLAAWGLDLEAARRRYRPDADREQSP